MTDEDWGHGLVRSLMLVSPVMPWRRPMRKAERLWMTPLSSPECAHTSPLHIAGAKRGSSVAPAPGHRCEGVSPKYVTVLKGGNGGVEARSVRVLEWCLQAPLDGISIRRPP